MLIEALVFSLRKKNKNLLSKVCVWQLPARRVFNTGRVGKSIIFHTLVVSTVFRGGFGNIGSVTS